jgi:PAS domain S-box-containing protein/diguanylate cyclase (GGDEF)-like protein
MLHISIKKLFIVVGLTLLILFLLLIAIFYKINSQYKTLTLIETSSTLEKEQLIEIDAISVYLTDLSRNFIITDSKIYKDLYAKNLEKKFDIEFEFSDKRVEKKWLEIEKKITSLIGLQTDAFALNIGLYKDSRNRYSHYQESNKSGAIQLLYSTKYLNLKKDIEKSIKDFHNCLENRSKSKAKSVRNKIEKNIFFFENILVLLILLFLFFAFALLKKILFPITQLTMSIQKFKSNKLDREQLQIIFKDEIGFMTEEFNRMKETIHRDFRQFEFHEKKIREYVSIIDKNVITSSTNIYGEITYVSKAFVKLSGYSKDELIGYNHSMIKHPDMSENIYKEMWKVISNDKIWRGEIKNKRKDGSFYWVDITIYPIFSGDGEKVGYSAIRFDITAQKRVEKLLVEIQNLNQESDELQNTLDKYLVSSITDLNGIIVDISQSFIEISGYSKDELVGKGHSIVQHPDNHNSPIYEEIWENIIHNRVWRGEIKNRSKNGESYWLDMEISPKFNRNGEKTGYFSVSQNITHKKRLKESLIRDKLTGVYNREYLYENIMKKIKLKESYVIAFLLEDYRNYNNICGQKKGDKTIVDIALKLKSLHSNIFRFGAEFYILLEKSEKEKIEYIIDEVSKIEILYQRSQSGYLKISHKVIAISNDKNYKEILRECSWGNS